MPVFGFVSALLDEESVLGKARPVHDWQFHTACRVDPAKPAPAGVQQPLELHQDVIVLADEFNGDGLQVVMLVHDSQVVLRGGGVLSGIGGQLGVMLAREVMHTVA